MRAIELYRRELAGPKEDFVLQHPHPFLVYTAGPKTGGTPMDSRVMTIDRFVVRAPPSEGGGSVMVAELISRDPSEKVVTIGLHAACDVAIDDSSLSKQHAWFARAADGWQIWDNDSVTGTQVNGQLLKFGFPRTLETGDVITLGYVELTFLPPEAFFSLVKYLG